MPNDDKYPILVGYCYGQPTFMVQTEILGEGALPDQDDAISIKKCLHNLLSKYQKNLKDFAEHKFKITPISKLSAFLTKTMSLYPFA
jgi:hypothetical protein